MFWKWVSAIEGATTLGGVAAIDMLDTLGDAAHRLGSIVGRRVLEGVSKRTKDGLPRKDPG
jgi:hypothetical protein